MHLSVNNISKTYPNGVKALDQLSLELTSGMFGLLGPNGAGKSSLMRTIATLQAPDTGSIYFNGADIFKDKIGFRKTLGYLPQDFGVYPKDSAAKLLEYFAVLKGITSKKDRSYKIDEVLAATNLTNVRKKRVSTFSGGMRQRFGIAQLLLNDPQLIIVDEPTAGLDPAERTRFLNVLRNIGSENIVLFSTHLVEDVSDLCNDMAIIQNGRLLSQIAPKAAVSKLEKKVWEGVLKHTTLQNVVNNWVKLSTHYNENNEMVTKVFSMERPGPTFTAVKAKLEDYYFLVLNKHDEK